VHIKMPKEVDKIFVGQPSNLGGGWSWWLGPSEPSGYFGLPMVNPSRPPLPSNRPYCWPFNYLEYVKDSNPNAHVRVFKVVIITNGQTNYAKIVNLFSFTLRDIMYDWCNNYMGDYLDCTFAKLY
jgi:hypothetical protein